MSISDSKNLDVVLDVARAGDRASGLLRGCPCAKSLNSPPALVLLLKQHAKDPEASLSNGRLIAYGEVVVVR
jgi:hypothetical protein